MRTDLKKGLKWITIEPGEYYVSMEKIVITTLLGSCVSACLYDPAHEIYGMNHFLLSNHRYSKKMPICITEAGRYGIHSMELIINKMLKLGARRQHIKAKVFGGGNVLECSSGTSNFFCVGDVNVRFIKEFLSNEKIPIISSALGGDSGRVIRFDTNTHNVFVRKIKKVYTAKIEKLEHKYWEKSMKEQKAKETTDSNIELW